MSRARSRTADSTDVKKPKGSGLPRRLNEKIALIKEKEQAQSKQFEQAMMSIFEMQQARLHGGGGSMPSLQAIDTTPPYPPPPYMPNMATSYHTPPTPLSPNTSSQQMSGSPRHMTLGRTQSCDGPADVGGPPRPQHYSQLWNVTGEWDNDLSRHKSDSDLQQSLLMEQQQLCRLNGQPPFISPSSNTHLSPQHYTSGAHHQLVVHQQRGNPLQLDTGLQDTSPANKRPTSMTAALLSPEQFSTSESPPFNSLSTQTAASSSLPDLTNMEFSSGLDVPIERDDDSPTLQKHTFFQPPGPSKLTTSIQANGGPIHHHSPYSSNPSAHQGVYHQHHHQQQQMPFFFGPHQQVTSGLTNSHFSPPQSHTQQHKMRPIMPSSSSSLSPLSLETSVSSHHHASNSFFTNASPTLSSAQPPHIVHHQKMADVPPSFLLSSPPVHQDSNSSQISHQAQTHPQPMRDSSHHYQPQQPQMYSSYDDSALLASQLHNTLRHQQFPHGSHFDQLQHQQQRLALQQRLASISMVSPPVRSHSEENLVKMQREILSNDANMAQNPFMGNLANASSVPCVYVEPNNVEPCIDQEDSPTTGTGSPSTSASHASSPPISRPPWINQPQSMQEYVFHEWPVDTQGQLMGEKVKIGSPLSHHKSLTELNKITSEVMLDLSSSYQNKNHQLSLPSIVMSDLTVDEQQAQAGGFLSHELGMEDEVMQSLLNADAGFVPFMLSDESSLPESTGLFHHRLNF